MARAERLRNEAMAIRRASILDLLSQGYTSVSDVARKLNISRSTAQRDVEYLKRESQKRLDTHIQQEIPFQYLRVMAGVNKVLRATHEILDTKDLDVKTKLQALQLLSTTYTKILELSADGGIISRAIEKVKQLEQSQQQKKSDVDSQNPDEASEIVAESAANSEAEAGEEPTEADTNEEE